MKIGQTIAIAALFGLFAGAAQAGIIGQASPIQHKSMASESKAPLTTGRSARHGHHHPAVIIHRHHHPHPIIRHHHHH